MNPEPKALSLIVYDFDGTLVNTLADITDSVNLALKELNLRSLSREIIRAYVGGGMHRLMEQALNGTGYDDIKHAVTLFRKHYSDHLLDQTEFYPNTRETVEHFSNK
ncbi:MAG: HAD hydrolase-like protein, partial [Nitrospinaceae bacterium]|nr:HAD hydrolase-like protein [Nitrospinaceae bacterium]